MHFLEWEAAVAAGAGLDELMKLEQYPSWFRGKLVAWHELHNLVQTHQQDAATQAAKKH